MKHLKNITIQVLKQASPPSRSGNGQTPVIQEDNKPESSGLSASILLFFFLFFGGFFLELLGALGVLDAGDPGDQSNQAAEE